MVHDGGDISFAGAGITAPSLRLCAETGCATKQTQFAPQLAHVVHNPPNVLCRRSCKGARKRDQKERSRHGSYGTGQAVFVTQENTISRRGQMVRDGGISPLPSAGITAPSRRLCAETGCATKQTQFAPQLARAAHNPSNALAGGVAGAMSLHRRNRKSMVCGIHVSQKSSAKQTHGENRRSLAAGD